MVATVASLFAWAVFGVSAVVQVTVYRRGLHAWPTGEDLLHVHVEGGVTRPPRRDGSIPVPWRSPR